MTEAELAQRALTALAPYFHIHPEHWGTHPTGKRLRIDAITVPRNPAEWSRPDIALGIEFKAPCLDRPDGIRERKDNAKIISQCIDYSLVNWDSFGAAPVFFCPGFAETSLLRDQAHKRETFSDGFRLGNAYLMAGVMGQNNVGELVEHPFLGWTFFINGGHRIWSGRYGVGEARLNKLLRTVGSR